MSHMPILPESPLEKKHCHLRLLNCHSGLVVVVVFLRCGGSKLSGRRGCSCDRSNVNLRVRGGGGGGGVVVVRGLNLGRDYVKNDVGLRKWGVGLRKWSGGGVIVVVVVVVGFLLFSPVLVVLVLFPISLFYICGPGYSGNLRHLVYSLYALGSSLPMDKCGSFMK
ncbi:hypothetical protein K501DRAFT_274393 [Backusella circina FSU 941]|nr:hypothetical protein K501DRAFT_274393 [Backusella circina FSU 941]